MRQPNTLQYYYDIPELMRECDELLKITRGRVLLMESACASMPSQGVARLDGQYGGGVSDPTPATLATWQQERRELRHDAEYCQLREECKQLERDLHRYHIDQLQIGFALVRLTPRQRMIVEARYLRGNSVPDIAEYLQIDDRTVRWHLTEAGRVVEAHLRLAVKGAEVSA